ncbi:hypothetical protein ACDT16_13790, partial [Staphylococcus aureus]
YISDEQVETILAMGAHMSRYAPLAATSTSLASSTSVTGCFPFDAALDLGALGARDLLGAMEKKLGFLSLEEKESELWKSDKALKPTILRLTKNQYAILFFPESNNIFLPRQFQSNIPSNIISILPT